MKSMNGLRSRESGAVAIFTVVFFMIFISVLAVSFIKIVADEQQQVADGDLSASALSAAQGGVEDGKRLIALCRETSDPTLESACDTALGNPDCDAVTGNGDLRAALGIRVDGNEGIIDTTAGDYLQRYTCLTVDTETPTVDSENLEQQASKIIPLRGTGGFTGIELSWHDLTATKNGPAALPSGAIGDFPTKDAWQGGGVAYPAMMRFQIMYHDKAGVNLDDLNTSVQTVFLSPASIGSNIVNLNAVDPPDPPGKDPNRPDTDGGNSRANIQCNVASGGYACRARVVLGVPAATVQNRDYYLRMTPLYNGTNTQLRLFNGITPVEFDNVQPSIDSTGRTNDVFRRVRSTVEYDSPVYLPEYAVETGGPICKNILSTGQPVGSQDRCTY